MEYNLLFNRYKEKAYRKNSADLIKIIRARHVKPCKVDEVLQQFSEKITARDWVGPIRAKMEKPTPVSILKRRVTLRPILNRIGFDRDIDLIVG